MPQGRPERASVAKLPIASATAPATSGQGPRAKRANPERGVGLSPSSDPWRRRSSTTVTAAIAANRTRLRASAVHGPHSFTSEVLGRVGRSVHQWKCAAPSVEPTMKKASVRSIRVEPPPTV